MAHTERFLYTTPENLPTAMSGGIVAPNEQEFPLDATVRVFTDDGHLMTFNIVKKGPEQSDYLLSLVSAEPPITEQLPSEKEVYVKGDRILRDKEFTLESALPVIIGRTTFTAMGIFSNVLVAEIPLIDLEEE